MTLQTSSMDFHRTLRAPESHINDRCFYLCGRTAELEGLINQQLEIRVRSSDEPSKLSALRICMGKLGDEMKLLVQKHYYQGFSVEELTLEAGVKHSTMTMRLHRLRDQLRQCISEQEGSCPL